MVKSIFKRSFCTILSLILALSCFCCTNLFFIDASAAVTVTSPTTTSSVAFWVPEVIYLYPNATSFKNATSTPFQWFVQNTVNTSAIYSQPTTNTTLSSTGNLYFAYPTAQNVTFSYRFLSNPNSETAMTGGSIGLSSTNPGKTGSYYTSFILGGQSPSIHSTDTGCYIEWTATYTDSVDGLTKAVVAYTYVYKPYVTAYAGATEARYDSRYYAGAITWLSGFHSYNPATLLSPTKETDGNASSGPRLETGYPNYSGENAFSAFISQTNKAFVDSSSVFSTSTRLNQPDFSGTVGTTNGYLSFANTTSSTNLFTVLPSNTNPEKYFSTTASESTFTDPSFEYVNAHGDDYTTVMSSSSHAANLFIDTSRYSNLSQIPNLSVGLMVTDDEQSTSNSGNWYLASYTGRTGSRSDHNGVDTSNYKSNTAWDDIFNDHGNLIAGHSAAFSNQSTSNGYSSEGVYYAGAWPEPISAQSGTKLYRVKGLYNNRHDSRGGMSSVILNLNATQINKSSLRTAVANATAKFASLGIKDNSFNTYYKFSSGSLQNFITLYQKAYGALTTLDKYYAGVSSQSLMDALASQLTEATKSISSSNHTVLVEHISASSEKVLKKESLTYQPGNTITITPDSINGYTYCGARLADGTELNPAPTITLSNVSEESIHYVLVYEPTVYSVSFDLDGGTADALPTEYSAENALVFPTAVKEGYVLKGWQYDDISVSYTFTPGSVFPFFSDASFCAVWVLEHTHVPTVLPAVPATCTTTGLTEGSVCSVCNQVLTAQETVPMTKHTYDAEEVVAATCTESGLMLYTCSVCSATKEETIPALGHDFETEFTVDKAATCIDEGNESKHCSRCDASIESQVIPANGHVYDDAEDMICNVCGDDRTPSVPTLKLSKVSAKCGEQIDVTLSISGNPGIISAFVKISYDNTKLRLVKVTNGDVMADSTLNTAGTLDKIPYTLFWEDGLAKENNTQNGTLGVLTFEVLEDAEIGETPITLEYVLNSTLNVDLEDVPFTLESGSVNISIRKPADANGDGAIDLKDVVVLQRYLCGGWNVEVDESNADVNQDGSLDLKDVVIMRRYLAGGWDIVLK